MRAAASKNEPRACADCRHSAPFEPTPGVGPQDVETTRRCVKLGLNVGATYACSHWRRLS